MNSPPHQRRAICEYVELEAPDEKVKRAEKLSSERIFGSVHDVWDVETDKNRWWVITEPTNLYLQSEFPSMDYVLSFHIGLMSRMIARQHTNATDEDIWRTPRAWRQWEQVHESLDAAEEAEDFQSVGARCREVLITLVDELNTEEPLSTTAPDMKKADVKGQLNAAYDVFAAGNAMRKIRAHLKASADATWELAGWLTHHKNAIRADATYVMAATEQLMVNTVSTVIRSERPKPSRCPNCGSYKVISDFRSELMYKVDHPYIELCEACGWEGDPPPQA
jgi:predicted RNA-binding Zn-ribbon protein involved in translation (DUF1610 family)